MYLFHLICIGLALLITPVQGASGVAQDTATSAQKPSAWANLPEHVVIASMDQSIPERQSGQYHQEPEDYDNQPEQASALDERDNDDEEEEINPAELASFFDALRTAFSVEPDEE